VHLWRRRSSTGVGGHDLHRPLAAVWALVHDPNLPAPLGVADEARERLAVAAQRIWSVTLADEEADREATSRVAADRLELRLGLTPHVVAATIMSS